MAATDWLPCPQCGATTRHDDGLCYRDRRHPRADRLARSIARGYDKGRQHDPSDPPRFSR